MKDRTRQEKFQLRKLAFFPAAFVAFLAVAFCAPAIEGRAVLVAVVVGLLLASAGLFVLAVFSSLTVDEQGLNVRLFSLREGRVSWNRLTTARYGMSFPSLALGITLTEIGGRRARLHFGYWADEDRLLALVAHRLLGAAPEMDAETAQIVALVTGTPAREARLRHVFLLDRRPGSRSTPRALSATRLAPMLAYLVAVVAIGSSLADRGASPLGTAGAFAAGGLAAAAMSAGARANSRGGVAVGFTLLVGPLAFLSATIGPAAAGYVLGFGGGLLVARLAGWRG